MGGACVWVESVCGRSLCRGLRGCMGGARVLEEPVVWEGPVYEESVCIRSARMYGRSLCVGRTCVVGDYIYI